MANVTISQLPAANPIQGDELVAIVQSGITVRTTTQALSSAPNQQQTFLTKLQEPTLPNSQYLSVGSGLTLQDGGTQSYLRIALSGASASLQGVSPGLLVKTSGTDIASRSVAVYGNGLEITNGDGIGGNPTLSLNGLPLSLANAVGPGIVVMPGNGTVTPRVLTGTVGQISVVNGNGASGNPTISIADNPVLPGTNAVTIPSGPTIITGGDAQFRFNEDTESFEGYSNGQWRTFSTAGGVSSFSAGATGFTPNTPISGAITLGGTLNVSSGGTGITTLTGYVKGNGTSPFSAVSTIPTTDLSGTISNAQLADSSITINGNSVSLGGSTTVTANTTSNLTFDDLGSGAVSGTSFNGSASYTISYNTIGASPLAGSPSLTTVGTITSGTWNGSPISNSYLSDSSLTIGTTNIALGGTSLTLGGLTSVTVTQDPVSALQLATKQYVDSVAQGLNVKAACAWGTTGNITLSGLGTQAGGEWTGSLTAGDRILVKNQSTAANNGIYAASSSGWTRTADADSWNELVSAFVFVQQGATLGDTGWVCTVDPGGTLGVTAVTFVQFSGAGTYTAGTGLTLTGTQFSITSTGVSANTYGSASSIPVFAVNAQGQITSVTNTSIAINGNQITSGTVGVGYGGTGLASYATGDMLYSSGATTLSKLALGTSGYVLTAGATAPQYVAQSTLSVGSATNATNVGVTANSTNATNYLTFVSATTGNLPQLVNSGITCDPSTGSMTGGIAGGTF